MSLRNTRSLAFLLLAAGCGGEASIATSPCAGVTCPEHQACTAETGECECVDACASEGPACDPDGSSQLGVCVADASGCRYVTALAPCAGAAQICPAGASACECPASPECVAGAQRCAELGDVEACGLDVTGCQGWLPAVDCTEHQVCDEAAGTAQCRCLDACPSVGAVQCDAVTPVDYALCSLDAAGCRYWAEASCEGSAACDSTAAAAGTVPPCACPATPVCALGEERCVDETVERCDLVGECPSFVAVETCATASEICFAQSGGAACVCAYPQCASAGEVLCDPVGGTTELLCLADPASAQGCFAAESSTCASTLQTCVVGTGCECTGETCDPLALDSSACVDGDTLAACTRDAGGCGVPRTIECTTEFGAGSTCVDGDTVTPAHCSCPAPSGSALYVDGAAGSDLTGTGAASPAACAFGSLTGALAHLAAPFDTVVLRPADPVAGAYGTAAPNPETFPVVIPAGATVTTDGASGEYVVDVDGGGATAAALVAADTATVRGLLVRDSAGVVSGALVSCSAGSLVLDGVELAATAASGVEVLSSCTLELRGAWSIHDAAIAGLHAAAPTGQVTLGGAGVVDANGRGVLLEDGVVETSPGAVVRITGSTAGANVHVAPASTTAPRFACAGCAIEGGAESGVLVASGASAGEVELAGGHVTGAAQQGIDLGGGKVTLSAAVEVSGHGENGVRTSAGTLTIEGGSEVVGNGGAGVEIGAAAVVLNGVTVSGNGGPGISLLAQSTGSLSGDAVLVTANGTIASPQPGILVSSGEVTLASATAPTRISGNSGGGIACTAATCTLTGVEVDGNTGGAGITVGGSSFGSGIPATAAITGCDVHGNGGTVTTGSGTTTTTLEVGGLVVLNGSLSSFTANRIYANDNSEVLVYFRGTGAAVIDLSAPDCASANVFACYGGGSGDYGVEARTGGGGGSLTVLAANGSWAVASPVEGTDFSTGVTVTAACAPVSDCP